MWAQRTVLSVKNGTACHTAPRYCASLVQSLVQDSGADSEQQSESWMYRWSVTDRKADPVVVVALRHRSLTMLEVESDQIWVRGQ